jgi:protein required for attachment to host cells
MQTTWVIAADSNRARIFELSAGGDKLNEIEDMFNPEGRQQLGEQVSDAEGNFAQGGPSRGMGSTGPGVMGAAIGGARGQGSTGEPQETVREHDINMFSKQLVRYLDQARNEHRFDKLRVIAPPKFLGLIRQNMSKEVQKMVEAEIPKEITGLETRNVEQYLQSLLH